MSDSARHAVDRADRARERSHQKSGNSGTKAISGASGTYAKGYDSDAARHKVDRLDRAALAGKKTEGGSRTNPLAPGVIPMGGKVPPGATPDVPNASPGQFAGLGAKLLPGGMLNDLPDAYDGVTKGFGGVSKGGLLGEALDQALGTEPGKQEGWRPDRYRGQNSLTGIGGSGGAVNSGEREIPGRSLGANNAPLTDEQAGETTPGGTGGDTYSDVMLKDRRKPYSGLKQMLETML